MMCKPQSTCSMCALSLKHLLSATANHIEGPLAWTERCLDHTQHHLLDME